MNRPRLTRDAARAAAYFEVEVGDASFKCRVPAAVELIAAGVFPPPVVDQHMTEQERKELATEQALETIERLANGEPKTVNALLAVMMVEPRLWRGEESACPEEWVPLSAMGPYTDGLLAACLPYIGYGEDRRKAVDFRSQEGDGADAAANGAGNREEPLTAA